MPKTETSTRGKRIPAIAKADKKAEKAEARRELKDLSVELRNALTALDGISRYREALPLIREARDLYTVLVKLERPEHMTAAQWQYNLAILRRFARLADWGESNTIHGFGPIADAPGTIAGGGGGGRVHGDIHERVFMDPNPKAPNQGGGGGSHESGDV